MDDFQAGHVYNITILGRAVPVKTKWPKYWQGETRGPSTRLRGKISRICRFLPVFRESACETEMVESFCNHRGNGADKFREDLTKLGLDNPVKNK